MRNLITALLILISVSSYGQSLNNTNTKFPNGLASGNGATPKPTSGLTAGAIWYTTGTGFQVYNGATWITLGEAGAGVTSFNGRTGAITPLVGDYPFFPLYDGTGATGTWGIGITGNAGAVTNGVYTNGSYANPSWITSLAWSKITGSPTSYPTPFSLSTGYGLSGTSFDGSVARTFTADTTSSDGLVSKSRLSTNLGGYVTNATNQTTGLTGNKTWEGTHIFTPDITVNGITVGKGANSVANNTFVGLGVATIVSTGDRNTGVGSLSMQNLTSGVDNTAIGFQSGRLITTANNMTAIGAATLAANQGDENTAVGSSALLVNTSGNHLNAFGRSTLSSNTTGTHNSGFGSFTMLGLTTGSDNVAFGGAGLTELIDGSRNSSFGYSSGRNLIGGDANTFLGGRISLPPSTTISNNIWISDGDGNVKLQHNGTGWTVTGSLGLTGARVSKGWFDDLEVTNPIAGSVTGNASTVTTNANLTGVITSVGNATSIASQTGTGSTIVTSVSPTITGTLTTNLVNTNDLVTMNANASARALDIVGRVSDDVALTIFWNNAKTIQNAKFTTSSSGLLIDGTVTLGSLGTGAVQATAGVLSVTSDSRLKDVKGFYKGSALTDLSKIERPRFWNYNVKSGMPKVARDVKQFGLLADKVHSVLGEEFAPTQKDGTYSLADRALLSLAIQALQEANKEIDALEARVKLLEK